MFATRLLWTVVLVIGVSMLGPVEAAEATDRVVRVSGEGFVKVVPDEVVLRMTITTVDDDLVRVRSDSDQQARAVLNLAKKRGVTEDRFQVSRLDLSLDYSEQLKRQIYEVERDIAIKLHELGKLDGLLSDLLEVPNSKITGISFGATKAREHQLAAIRWAVADAREKATLLARLNGLTLGNASEIQVAQEGQSPFVISVIPVVGAADDPFGIEGGEAKGSTHATRGAVQGLGDSPPKEAEAAGKTTPFGLGLIEFTASVSIDFELVAE